MIRILHNIGTLSNGGMESFIMNLYRHIDRNKVQFDFVVGHKTDLFLPYADEILSMGGRLFFLNESVPAVVQFGRILQENPEYRIVHSHRDAMSTFFLRQAQRQGVPVRIAHSHNASETGFKKKVVTRLLRPLLNHYSTLQLACGQEAGQHLFGGGRFKVFPNSIDISQYKYNEQISVAKRNEIGIGLDNLLIGNVGRFSQQKNHFFILEIFERILEKNGKARLLLVGTGQLMTPVWNKAKEKSMLDKIIFLENRTDVNELLQAMDIVLFPSLYEGFSMAMVEMQAAGLRILSSDRVPKEINVTGLVTFKGLNDSASSWADELLHLSQYERNSIHNELLVTAGLDVRGNAKMLQEMYIELYNANY